MTNQEIRIIPELNITIEVNYISSVSDTVDIDYFISAVKDSCARTSKYNPNLFNNLKIVIWNKDRADIPIAISHSGGLTYDWLNLIELNTNCMTTHEEVCHLLGHEMGHYYAKISGFDNEESILRKEWNRIRYLDCFINGKEIISPSELVAEDCRLFFGPFFTFYYQRWDINLGRYRQAGEVIGYRDLLLIWKKASEFIKAGIPGFSLKSTEFIYSLVDFSYCGIKLKYSRQWRFLWWTWEEIKSVSLDRNNI